MPKSPSNIPNDVVLLNIVSDGKTIPDTIELVSVSIHRAVNAIPSARLVFRDGDLASQDWPASDGKFFVPGAQISISAGYGRRKEKLFDGIVVRHGIEITADNGALLLIECRDKAVRMTIGRNNASFVNTKDSDIITKLVSDHGLTSDVAATRTTFKEIVQRESTDWDYALTRARLNGFLLIATDGKVSAKPPQTARAASLKVTSGKDLMEFDADIDARTQLSSVTALAWDPKKQDVLRGRAAGPENLNLGGNLSSTQLAAVAGPDEFYLRTTAPMNKAVLGTRAKARQIRAGLAKTRGSMKFQGSAKARVGEVIELGGLSQRFNGNVFVTAVNHTISEGDWITEAEFGVDPDWFVERPEDSGPRASNRMPAISGLQIGVVERLAGDPESAHRVQVSIPVLDVRVWARLAEFYGSSGFGAFFVPEIGDEVVLGYLDDDPTHPVILGSLYSSKHKPAYTPSAENNIKALVTRSGMKLEFDDDKKAVTIRTPEGNRLVLSEEDESITLEDQNNNKMTMNSDGIDLSSPKDITISADGSVSIKAKGKLDLEATQDVAIAGLNVNAEAQVALTAKGSESAELSAAGQTTVKGAMVMIN